MPNENKSHLKTYMVWFHFCETSRMEKSKKEGTEIRGCLGLGGGKNGEFLLKVKEFLSRDENVLKR